MVAVEGCPGCDGNGRSTLIRVTTTRPFSVARCERCGLAYAVPRPTEEELDEFYAKAYFDQGDGRLGYVDYRGDSWAEVNARAMWPSLWKWADFNPPDRTLLDVGCATGAFLRAAREAGWAVHGVERSEAAGAIANRENGIVVSAAIDDVDGAFGLITMWHVLEHVLDPAHLLIEARKRLLPGGYLLVELPNWGSLGRRLRRGRWRQLRPPEHINFFDAPSLKRALTGAGFEVVALSTLQPDALDNAFDRIRYGNLGHGLATALATRATEKTGLGGYLRCLSRPSVRLPVDSDRLAQ